MEKLRSRIQKDKEEDYTRNGILEGQIITKRDERERYMKTVIKEKTMLDSMNFKFNNRYFLFINELDINNLYSNSVAMQQMEFEREIKLHYTLYHK